MSPSFGVFAPVGYVIIAFSDESQAANARDALRTGGYDDDEVQAFSSQQVVADIERRRSELSLLAFLGDDPWIQSHQLEHAKEGEPFLVVYAPTDQETARVMNVARRFGARLAHKYKRGAVEELLVGPSGS